MRTRRTQKLRTTIHRNAVVRRTGLGVGVVAILLIATACAAGPGASPSPTSSESPTLSPTGSALISIDLPAAGASVPVPIALSGTANTFEAAVTIDAVNAAGDTLCVRNIQATSGSGTPGSWDSTLAFPPPNSDLPVTLRAYELSAKDGSVVNLVERDVTVSPVRPAIILTSPICGALMTNPGEQFLIEGRATVFEAALSVQMRSASGTIVFTRDLMTEVGSEESGFSGYVTLPAGTPAGFYDVVAFDYSPKDGSIENEFSVQVRVQP